MASQSVYVYDTLEALTQGTIPGEFSGTIFNFLQSHPLIVMVRKCYGLFLFTLLNSDNKSKSKGFIS